MVIGRQTSSRALTSICALGVFFTLAGCENGEFQNPFQSGAAKPAASSNLTAQSGATEERDIEAPEVFSASEPGLWDGRPSLGGVWVSHPDVKDPERVIIRNTKNGKFVIGALFRPSNDRPGPRLAVSSDAAEALGMLAGSPTQLDVVALRRETVTLPPIASETPEAAMPAAPEITATSLDPIAAASAAIDAAESTANASVTQPAVAPVPAAAAPAPRTSASTLTKPFVQIGIFSVEANARNTATSLRQIGIFPTVKKQTSKGKTFWRVIVGPATTSAERAGLLKKIKGQGFSGAYFVTN
jgi:rare lipoprotein A